MITLSGTAFADQTQKAAVFELYSVDGYYQDSLGISQTILIMCRSSMQTVLLQKR